MTTDQDKTMEQLLQRYRPAGPSEELRARVLASASVMSKPKRTWRTWVFRAALAAMMLLAIGLRFTSNLSFVAAIFATPGKGF